MALFQKVRSEPQPDRRKATRLVVDCEASFKMVGGTRHGRLTDLSSEGARFETESPPAKGVSGLLEWVGEAHFGRVIWTDDGTCGLRFERPIALTTVEKCAEVEHVSVGPVANYGNIPLGRKRSLRQSLTPSE